LGVVPAHVSVLVDDRARVTSPRPEACPGKRGDQLGRQGQRHDPKSAAAKVADRYASLATGLSNHRP